jgi:sulfite exporter TauE/SafE
MLTFSLLFGVFLIALVNGWHCALMCGGIASMMEKSSFNSITFVKPSQLFYQQVIMHLGRITTYSILGAIAAGIGMQVWQQEVVAIQRPLFLFTSLFLIFTGFRLLKKTQRSSDFFNKIIGSKLAIVWSSFIGSLGSSPKRWFSGILWGLVPCGLIYSALPLAFLSGNVLTGFLIMLAFGLGTLPNLLMLSKFTGFLAQVGRYPWVRYLTALVFIGSGVFGIYRAWTLPYALLKEGFCFS